MRAYRIYSFDKDGHIREAPEIVECEDDDAAIQHAKQLINGKAIEVWEKGRCVLRLFPARR